MVFELLEPGVSEAVEGGGSGLRVVLEHVGNEILGVFRDTGPLLFGEFVAAFLHSLHDVFVGISVEGRVAAKQNVEDDSA